jgi:hypothetical protein
MPTFGFTVEGLLSRKCEQMGRKGAQMIQVVVLEDGPRRHVLTDQVTGAGAGTSARFA